MDQQVPPASMFFRSTEIAPTPFPQFVGLTARLIAGDNLMSLFDRLEPGTVLPLHRHLSWLPSPSAA